LFTIAIRIIEGGRWFDTQHQPGTYFPTGKEGEGQLLKKGEEYDFPIHFSVFANCRLVYFCFNDLESILQD
jgi:hypothetical protein